MLNNKIIGRDIIYTLRKNGWPVTIYRDVTTKNMKTGIITVVSRNVQYIKKAAVLPTREDVKFSYDLSYVAANKNFTYGGLLDVKTIIVLIDKRDLEWELILTDYLTFNKSKYELKEINDVLGTSFIGVIGTAVKGQVANELIPKYSEELLTFSDDLSYVVE